MKTKTICLCLFSAIPLSAGRPADAQRTSWTGRAAEKTITVDDRTRSFLLFAPRNSEGRLPLVFVLHGGGGNSRQIERYTRFNQLAEKEKFLVCYPQGYEGNWNDGRDAEVIQAQTENIDDVKFVRQVVKAIADEHKLDRSRVFATGISNGAFMSHRLAAEASDLIAAVAPVVGGMAPAIAEDFNPSHRVSLLVLQGDSDPLVPIDGGEVGFRRGKKRGRLVPTQEAVAKYVERNGINGKPKTSLLKDADPDDGTTTEVTIYPDGPGEVKVQLYTVRNGGHAWPGRPPYLSERLIGKVSQDFDATEAIWQFFESCPPRKLE